MKKYSTHRNYTVRYHVVSNPNCPADLLEILSKDISETVICHVANNKNCPVYILENLYNNKNSKTEWELVQNEKCPSYILEDLFFNYIENKPFQDNKKNNLLF